MKFQAQWPPGPNEWHANVGGERSHSFSPISSPLQVFARSPTSGLHLGPNALSKLQKAEQIQRRAGPISLPTDPRASGPDGILISWR